MSQKASIIVLYYYLLYIFEQCAVLSRLYKSNPRTPNKIKITPPHRLPVWLVGSCILLGDATVHITPPLSPWRTFPTKASAKSWRFALWNEGVDLLLQPFGARPDWCVRRQKKKKGRHTQLGSGCLSCILAFPASRRQPCGKALKRVTATRMRTVIMPWPVYRSVRRAEPGFGRERRSPAWIVY